ncbi:unnamed protein product [Albugo candida]|uniref:Glycoside hydrolase 131 catalytic N-terminal domain-containing protein n=1 Tax=Albugo candida TaxID=65357 RepID=A0A024GDA0_9STRA|nr:unnamed protein product [Albugo candida]|eukprot:CCI44308.1 unnamed protein product [Albugo candida]
MNRSFINIVIILSLQYLAILGQTLVRFASEGFFPSSNIVVYYRTTISKNPCLEYSTSVERETSVEMERTSIFNNLFHHNDGWFKFEIQADSAHFNFSIDGAIVDDNNGKGYFAPEVAFWAVNGIVTPTLEQKPFTIFYQTSWKKPTIKFLEDSKWVSTTMDRHDGSYSPFFKGIHQWYYYTQEAAGNFTYAFKSDTSTDDNDGRFYQAFGGGVWFHVSKVGPPQNVYTEHGSEVIVPVPQVEQ